MSWDVPNSGLKEQRVQIRRFALRLAGVVIVQDYVGFPQQPGHQIVHSDEADRKDHSTWTLVQ